MNMRFCLLNVVHIRITWFQGPTRDFIDFFFNILEGFYNFQFIFL
jgi:hypothetical protein